MSIREYPRSEPQPYYHHEVVEWVLISLASGVALSAFGFIGLLMWLTIKI